MYINSNRNKSFSQPTSPFINPSQLYSPIPFRTPVIPSTTREITTFPWNELFAVNEGHEFTSQRPNRLLLKRIQGLEVEEFPANRYIQRNEVNCSESGEQSANELGESAAFGEREAEDDENFPTRPPSRASNPVVFDEAFQKMNSFNLGESPLTRTKVNRRVGDQRLEQVF